jgi:laminin gamma 1
VGGDRCDKCLPNHFDFSASGCRTCACDAAGSMNNNPSCAVNSGVCRCKEQVEGQNCDRCRPGFFNLNIHNEFGCTRCFCFGHSSQCAVSKEYKHVRISSDFRRSLDGWTAGDNCIAGSSCRNVTLDWTSSARMLQATPTREVDPVFFVAPPRFLGDQKFSYNQFLKFRLRVSSQESRASRGDVTLEGGGLKVESATVRQTMLRNKMTK